MLIKISKCTFPSFIYIIDIISYEFKSQLVTSTDIALSGKVFMLNLSLSIKRYKVLINS